MRGHGVVYWTLSFLVAWSYWMSLQMSLPMRILRRTIDGIGEATYILGRDLREIRIVEAMEYLQ